MQKALPYPSGRRPIRMMRGGARPISRSKAFRECDAYMDYKESKVREGLAPLLDINLPFPVMSSSLLTKRINTTRCCARLGLLSAVDCAVLQLTGRDDVDRYAIKLTHFTTVFQTKGSHSGV
jgi:hypothetical protein